MEDEKTFADRQERMIDGICKVIDENDATVFEAWRVLHIMEVVAKEQAKEAYRELSESIDGLMEALSDVEDAMNLMESE